MAEIRNLEVGEHDLLRRLCEAVLADFGPSPSGPEAFLEDPASFVLGAYVGEEPVGLAWGLQMRSPSGRLTTYLHELEVREPWRRLGIATALVTAAFDRARRDGSIRFWLSTGGHNQVAQAVYESLGGERKPAGDLNYWWRLD